MFLVTDHIDYGITSDRSEPRLNVRAKDYQKRHRLEAAAASEKRGHPNRFFCCDYKGENRVYLL
jgi:hypothetical protein